MLGQKLMGMASAPGNIVAALGRPVHMVMSLDAAKHASAAVRAATRRVPPASVAAGRAATRAVAAHRNVRGCQGRGPPATRAGRAVCLPVGAQGVVMCARACAYATGDAG